MTKRGGKQGGTKEGRNGGGGGRGGSFRGRGGFRGGRRGGFGGGEGLGNGDNGFGNNEFYDEYDYDEIIMVGRNHEHRQRSAEEEVYRRLQQAKANRGGGGGSNGHGRAGGSGGSRTDSFNGFRPPPPPKQNGKGKNSKHVFWPHPDHNSNNNSNSNSNRGNYNAGGQPSTLSRDKKSGQRTVAFQKATASSVPDVANQDPQNAECDVSEGEDNSANESSDDMSHRGTDCDDESDEDGGLMHQFDYLDHPGKTVEQSSVPQQQHQQRSSGRIAATSIVNAVVEPLSSLTIEGAMTQSEDLLQAIEAEGDIEIHADEIEELSRPISALSTTSSKPLRKGKGAKASGAQLKAVQSALSEPHTEVVKADSSANGLDVSTATEKPKKKAHRSKRGGIKQRERQLQRQMIVGNDDDGPMYLEPSDDEEELLAMDDYVQNTKDQASLVRLESLIGALTGLGSAGYGYSKDLGDVACDDSDLDDQLSEGDIQDDLDDLDDVEDDLDDLDLDEDDEDEFDFEDDYEDSIRKMDFGKVVTSVNDTRKNRKADDLLREELRDLMPLWRSGALQDGDGANRRFKSKSRAKGYDLYDPDDGFMIPSSATRKKNKEPHGGSFQTLLNLNSQIEEFVKDRNNDVLDLPPMPKPLRRKIHLLCNHYCLRSQSHGSGKNRYPVLIKTDRTKMPVNPVNLHKLANQPERELKELTKLSAQFQGSRKGNGGGGGKGMGKGRGGKPAGGGISAAVHGTVVGASASEISSENVGHRMLSKMGWTPGDGLGATGDGIKQPIEAIMRAKRWGLGHQ